MHWVTISYLKQARGYHSNATQTALRMEALGLGSVVISTPDFHGLEPDSKPTYQNTRRFRKAWISGC